MRMPRFQTLANGEPIENRQLDAPAINIIHAIEFEEIEARASAGLSQEEYEGLPGTPDWIAESGPTLSKSHIIAWHRMRNRITALQEKAAADRSRR